MFNYAHLRLSAWMKMMTGNRERYRKLCNYLDKRAKR